MQCDLAQAGWKESWGGRTAKKKTDGYWVIPGLLLLELFTVVLFTTDTRTAVAVVLLFPDEVDLLLGGVAMLLARTEFGRGGRVGRDLSTLPPRPVVMGKLDLYLLVGVCRDRLLLVGVTVRRGEDAEGDGDSCFKIQVDCLVWARRVSLPLDLFVLRLG